jgi:DNA-binding NtrC family response regulator
VAHALHNLSRRATRPFVVQDCGAIPKDLVESILFGHEKGSFTGAHSQHRGCFEQAAGGTLFLDEIGELDLAMQPKLLRVLETREIKRVGGDRTVKVDVRVVAATNRDLRDMVEQGRFREDLYFRLSVIQISLPSLRERKEDVSILAREFLRDIGERRGLGGPLGMSSDALGSLESHAWPGNVRELRNVIERAASLADGPEISSADLAFQPVGSVAVVGGPGESLVKDGFEGLSFKEAKASILDRFELAYLSEAIQRHTGNISRAAADAGLTRFHLRELLKKHGIQPRRGATEGPADGVEEEEA